VYAQRPEIGLLLANGFTRGQVLRHVLGFGVVPAVVGAVPGAILGSILGRVITGLYTELLSIPVKVVRFAPDTIVLAVVLAVVVLKLGGYKLLDRLSKVFVLILTLTTLVAAALSLPRIDWSPSGFLLPELDLATYAFIIALMGFMPKDVPYLAKPFTPGQYRTFLRELLG